MGEDLLSKLANPERYAMLKEKGAIDEKEIDAQIKDQDRAQNLRQGKPQENSQPVQQNRAEPVNGLDDASKHPEQNTLAGFSKPEEVVEQSVVEEKPIQSAMPEPERDPEPRSVVPEPPKEEPTKSKTSQDEDIGKVESLFKKLINNDP